MTDIDLEAFKAELVAGGYTPAEKTMAPKERNEPHSHDVEVLLMVTEGEFTVHVDGKPQRVRPGERFSLNAGCTHYEEAGPEGVSLVAGRRPPK